jgi:hypothetical protein
MRRVHAQAGVTLAEVIIMVLLLGVLAMLTNVALKILNGLQREGSRIQTNRDAGIYLYEMSKEIRNAKSILYISSDTLKFTTYDFSEGFDWKDPNDPGSPGTSTVLFKPTRTSTITYTCVLDAGVPVLQREETKPLGVDRKTSNFRGIILMPDPFALPDPKLTYIFQPQIGASAPYSFVSIHLRLAPGFHRKEPLEYTIDAAVRAFGGQ